MLPPTGIVALWIAPPPAIHRDVGRAAADVEQHARRRASLPSSSVAAERCQRLEHDPGRFETGAVHALEHVGDEARAAGDDVRVDFEPAARHPERIGDAVLSVDRVSAAAARG